MKRLVTGVDSNGRSCVVEEADLGPSDVADMEQHIVFRTSESPPPPRPAGHGADMDLGVAPGLTRWTVVQWPPDRDAPMHHTDTVDFDIVVAGSIDLILDDGTHHLEPGDCVLVNGVDHAWKAGPEGCTLSVVLLGSTPPA